MFCLVQMVDRAAAMFHNWATKISPIRTEKVGFDDGGAKAVIELWFEFIGGGIFYFMWESSQPPPAEKDRGKIQTPNPTTVGSRQTKRPQTLSQKKIQFKKGGPE